MVQDLKWWLPLPLQASSPFGFGKSVLAWPSRRRGFLASLLFVCTLILRGFIGWRQRRGPTENRPRSSTLVAFTRWSILSPHILSWLTTVARTALIDLPFLMLSASLRHIIGKGRSRPHSKGTDRSSNYQALLYVLLHEVLLWLTP
jgi:hypothetical protein